MNGCLAMASVWGIKLSYIIQEKPIGLAHAFILGREFVGSDRVALILGDNVFYGHGLSAELAKAVTHEDGATIFAYYVSEPDKYGVVKFDDSDKPVDIVEKPTQVLSNWAVTGFISMIILCSTLQPTSARQRGENWKSPTSTGDIWS